MSCATPLTDATVPTGMNTGVSTSPCGVISRPARARPLVASMRNSIDIVWNCSVRCQVLGLGSRLLSLGTRYQVLFSLPLHLPDKLANAHDGPAHSAAPNFLKIVARGDTQRVEAS